MSEYRLEMCDVVKTFPGVKALNHAQLKLKPGTVHALMGENGAGKSTLMKCMFGIYHMDEGEVIYEGEKVQIKDGEVYIDGDKLKEKYRFPTMENGGLALEEFTLSEGEYFMLCDNRNECEDSRNANVGNVMSENIVGKAWIRTNHFTLVNRINGFEQKHADPSASPTASAAAN